MWVPSQFFKITCKYIDLLWQCLLYVSLINIKLEELCTLEAALQTKRKFLFILGRSEEWTEPMWEPQQKHILLNVTSPFILHFVSVYLLVQFHLLLFLLKTNLCPSIELHQIECDKGNFPAIMMSVQPVSTQGMEMSLGTGKGILTDTMIHTMNAEIPWERELSG